MRFVTAVTLALMSVGGVHAIAPPVEHPSAPPPFSGSPPGSSHPDTPPPFILPDGPAPSPPAMVAPEPSTLALVGIGLATTAAYRLIRRRVM